MATHMHARTHTHTHYGITCTMYIQYFLVWNGVLSSIHGMEILSEGDLSLFPNLIPGLGVWYHLYHTTLTWNGDTTYMYMYIYTIEIHVQYIHMYINTCTCTSLMNMIRSKYTIHQLQWLLLRHMYMENMYIAH